jgi:hypothetical protein
MKHYFTEPYETWTLEANNIDREVGKFLKPIIDHAVESDYSLRDLNVVLHSAVDMAMSTAILTRNVKLKKAKDAEKCQLSNGSSVTST